MDDISDIIKFNHNHSKENGEFAGGTGGPGMPGGFHMGGHGMGNGVNHSAKEHVQRAKLRAMQEEAKATNKKPNGLPAHQTYDAKGYAHAMDPMHPEGTQAERKFNNAKRLAENGGKNTKMPGGRSMGMQTNAGKWRGKQSSTQAAIDQGVINNDPRRNAVDAYVTGRR